METEVIGSAEAKEGSECTLAKLIAKVNTNISPDELIVNISYVSEKPHRR